MDQEHADYAARGYFIERGLISTATIERLKGRIAEALEVGSLADVMFDDQRAGGDSPRGPERFRKVAGLCRRHRDVWEEFVACPRVIELNRELVGDDVRQWFNAVFTKPARVGEATPWHQDIGLWTQRPQTRHLRPVYADALSFWVALDPATRENGCLQVVPGSHLGPVVDHVQYPDAVHVEIPRGLTGGLTIDHVPLEPGDAIVWHAHLWHYSPPNTSDRNRWAMAMVTLRDADARTSGHDLPWLVRTGQPQPFSGPDGDEGCPAPAVAGGAIGPARSR